MLSINELVQRNVCRLCLLSHYMEHLLDIDAQQACAVGAAVRRAQAVSAVDTRATCDGGMERVMWT